MIRCIRCVTAYHRKCATERDSLRMVTSRTFLCNRCYNHTPKGLNMPDPVMARDVKGAMRGAHALTLPEDVDDGVSLDGFVAAKLGLRGQAEFETPADLRDALASNEVVATSSFAPPPYTVLKRSIYMHKQAREMLLAIDQQMCSCASSVGVCDERCPNRALQQECSSVICSCTQQTCKNRPFSELASSGANPLVLFKTEHKGWGVKAMRHIFEGELVIEYVGEVINRDEWEARKEQLDRFDHMYFMALNHMEIVDASRKGNVARFINHSCSPNLTVEKWCVLPHAPEGYLCVLPHALSTANAPQLCMHGALPPAHYLYATFA